MRNIVIFIFFLFFMFLSIPAISDDNTPDIPKRPMFPEKQINTGPWKKESSSRVGVYNVSVSNIKPVVYYYECPYGETVKSKDPNACDASPEPFGGIFETIKTSHCIQHICAQAEYEGEPGTIYSGCGLMDDGEWE